MMTLLPLAPRPAAQTRTGLDALAYELATAGVFHALCGSYHFHADEGQTQIICCDCWHAHAPSGQCLAFGPCGSALCCAD